MILWFVCVPLESNGMSLRIYLYLNVELWKCGWNVLAGSDNVARWNVMNVTQAHTKIHNNDRGAGGWKRRITISEFLTLAERLVKFLFLSGLVRIKYHHSHWILGSNRFIQETEFKVNFFQPCCANRSGPRLLSVTQLRVGNVCYSSRSSDKIIGIINICRRLQVHAG